MMPMCYPQRGLPLPAALKKTRQISTAIERIYVNKRIAEKFAASVTEIAQAYRIYRVGRWNESEVNLGPIVNHCLYAKVLTHIRDAEDKGAHILLGGSEQTEPYIHPTVIAGMTADMLIEQEETFGPEIDGKIQEKRETFIKTLENFLALPLKEQMLFSIGRRTHRFARFTDLHDLE